MLHSNSVHAIRKIFKYFKRNNISLKGVKQNDVIKRYVKENGIEIEYVGKVNIWSVMPAYLSGKYEFFRPTYIDKFRNSREWQELRKKVFQVYGYRCMCCGLIDKSNAVDHIYPMSLYPDLKNDFNNLQVLCRRCNSKKGNKFVVDYRNG